MTWKPTCPQCGHKWQPSHVRGRPKKLITAEGLTLSIGDWANLLEISANAIRYHLRCGKPFLEIYRRFNHAPKHPGPVPKGPIIVMGNHAWRKP